MKNTLLFIFFTLPFYLSAQQIPPMSPNKMINGQREGDWVLWYDSSDNMVQRIEETYYYRKIFFKNGKPQGIVRDYYPGGKIQWEGTLLSIDPDVFDGACTAYYRNGKIQIKCAYVLDELDGSFESYYESGQLEMRTTFKAGKEVGKIETYYENGRKQTEGYYENGEMVGDWVWYRENGSIETKGNYSLSDEEKVWEAKNNTMMDYYDAGENKKALTAGDDLLNYTKKTFGTNHIYYETALNNLAGVYDNLEQYDKALALYLESLEVTLRVVGKEHPDYGTRLNNLASLYQRMGNYEKALPLFIEALECAKKYLPKDDPSYGIRLSNLAVLYNDMGEYDKAQPLYEEALEVTKKAVGERDPSYGIRLNNIGIFYTQIGQYDKALSYLTTALENTRNNYGTEHASYSTSLNNLAMLYEKMGQYNKALSMYEEALNITAKTLGKENSQYGIYLDNIAGLYHHLGQYDKALAMYEQSIAIKKKSLGTNHPDYGSGLNNLANLYLSMEDYDKAMPLFQESLKIFKSSVGKESPQYATALNNIANIYRYQGEYDKALALYKESIKITEKKFGKHHPEYAVGLGNLALMYDFMGQYEKALPLYEEDLNIKKTTYGVNHPSYGLSLNNLAGIYQVTGNTDKAFQLYKEGFENLKMQITQTFSFLSEQEKEKFIKSVEYNFPTYQNFFTNYYKTNPQVASTAYDIELMNKGLILYSTQTMRQSIEKISNPEVLQIYDAWLTKKSQLSAQYTLPVAEQSSNLAKWETEAENLEKRLLQYSKELGNNLQIGKTTWRDVQQKLLPWEVAIEFANFEDYNGATWSDTVHYVAIIVRKDDKQPIIVPLFNQYEMDNLLSNAGNGVNGVNNLYRGSIASSTVQHDLSKIYDLVWKPIEKYIKEGQTVYFSPSGTLNQIAFAAIVTPDGKYLSDKYSLKQVSTTAKILDNDKTIKLNDLALFGGVNYDLSSDIMASSARKIKDNGTFSSGSFTPIATRGGESWDYLQGTLSEVQNIKNIAERNKIRIEYFSGNNALEEQYKALNGKHSPSVLHIATHGFFFPDPKQNKQDINKNIKMGQEQITFKTSDNPLNRSGLLFAGANNTWRGQGQTAGVDDGVLTSYEVSTISLPNTQLVVLSACETGLGDIKGSEGVYGLQRSFKMAGVKYLIMSLWQVPDKETAEFMEYFYGKLFAIKNIEESFELSQKYMKAKYPNEPYKWAAFVLVK